MIEDIQKLIIKFLGAICIVTLIEVFILLAVMPNVDITAIVALISLVNTIVGGLIGFLTGKKMSEIETQMLREKVYGQGVECEEKEPDFEEIVEEYVTEAEEVPDEEIKEEEGA